MIPGALTAQLDAPDAVRAPLFEIRMGGASSGGLASSIGSAVGLGGSDDPWQRSLESLSVTTGLAPFADYVVIAVAADEHAPDVTVGDEGSVRLGFSDSGAVDVFNGRVQSLRDGLDGARHIELANAAVLMSSARINQSYEQQKASDIISDLAGRFGIDTDLADTGVQLPFHVIDDRRNAYEHVAKLTGDSGQLAFVGADGTLRSAPFETGDIVQEFRYGADIVDIHADELAPLVDSVQVVGEGAAGSQGAEAWNWLSKDPAANTGKAGSGDRQRSYSDGSVRSAEAARGAAAARLMRSTAQNRRIRISVSGAPAVNAGATIKILDAPQAELNGSALVYRSCHIYDKQNGLMTHLFAWQFPEGGFGDLVGAIGGLL